eukprot:scaffold145503_cov15-Tisochrysis_lutea.AAC.1
MLECVLAIEQGHSSCQLVAQVQLVTAHGCARAQSNLPCLLLLTAACAHCCLCLTASLLTVTASWGHSWGLLTRCLPKRSTSINIPRPSSKGSATWRSSR